MCSEAVLQCHLPDVVDVDDGAAGDGVSAQVDDVMAVAVGDVSAAVGGDLVEVVAADGGAPDGFGRATAVPAQFRSADLDCSTAPMAPDPGPSPNSF